MLRKISLCMHAHMSNAWLTLPPWWMLIQPTSQQTVLKEAAAAYLPPKCMPYCLNLACGSASSSGDCAASFVGGWLLQRCLCPRLQRAAPTECGPPSCDDVVCARPILRSGSQEDISLARTICGQWGQVKISPTSARQPLLHLYQAAGMTEGDQDP